eukprot:CAMPEP_0170479804 /NCGR_PEP_ID=MMETSP0208-20121228/892_1 /TAXON_ID=197538 /ORGANISM="Strombidium inclinatum, Strain S3" /LENGTH=74 /DNA_ID=CAMNT_0010752259 /DNA_START=126 /DNA_END=350 /DNA_ORIENTATION=+
MPRGIDQETNPEAFSLGSLEDDEVINEPTAEEKRAGFMFLRKYIKYIEASAKYQQYRESVSNFHFQWPLFQKKD